MATAAKYRGDSVNQRRENVAHRSCRLTEKGASQLLPVSRARDTCAGLERTRTRVRSGGDNRPEVATIVGRQFHVDVDAARNPEEHWTSVRHVDQYDIGVFLRAIEYDARFPSDVMSNVRSLPQSLNRVS